ncbi:MAG: NUDIX domain-containing protein [Candidatus Doudnabacteria bacterium]|nr:NUDIX domain-containing protein [Candidatus Doudnabacteria bacterium]
MAEKSRPKVGVGVYILNGHNQVLMLLEHRPDSGDTWAPPGGHLAFDEQFLDCVKRETREETDLEVHDAELWAINNNISVPNDRFSHYVNLDFLVNSFEGSPKIMGPKKCKKIDWFNLNSLLEPLLRAPQNFFNNNPKCLCRSGKKFLDCHGK